MLSASLVTSAGNCAAAVSKISCRKRRLAVRGIALRLTITTSAQDGSATSARTTAAPTCPVPPMIKTRNAILDWIVSFDYAFLERHAPVVANRPGSSRVCPSCFDVHRIQHHDEPIHIACTICMRSSFMGRMRRNGFDSRRRIGILLVLYPPRQTKHPEDDRIHPTVGKVALEERGELRVRPDQVTGSGTGRPHRPEDRQRCLRRSG